MSTGKSIGNASAASDKLKALGVEIFAIGIGDGPVKTELNSIASEPAAGHVFMVGYGELLHTLSLSLAERICQGNLTKVYFLFSN